MSAEGRGTAEGRRSSRVVHPLVIVLAVSFVMKVAVFAFAVSNDRERFIARDTNSYHKPALALLASGRFSLSPQHLDIPESMRTPGYPLFLSGIYAIAGESFPAVVFVQILVSLGTISVVYATGRLLLDESAALVAAVVASLDVVSFSFVFQILSETLFALLVAVATYFAVRVLQRRGETTRDAALFGVALGAAVLVRPVAYYLVPAALLFLVAAGWKARAGRAAVVRHAAAFLLPAILLVGGWQVRNHLAYGSAAFTEVEGFNMLYNRAADAVSRERGITLGNARHSFEGLSAREAGSMAKMDPAAGHGDRWKREGVRLILAHPVGELKSIRSGMARIVLGPGERVLLTVLGVQNKYDDRKFLFHELKGLTGSPVAVTIFLASAAYLVILWLSAATGYVTLVRGGRDLAVHMFLFLTCLYFLVVSAGPESYSRLRVPFTSILAIYAGAGLSSWSRKRVTSNE